ncbi:MAG: hypothetical protein EOP04_09560 [Proteobacteria bacterium]|nr:MAG: hypothetical protein EOP04_09560 [Pseudomonadota bacterium]
MSVTKIFVSIFYILVISVTWILGGTVPHIGTYGILLILIAGIFFFIKLNDFKKISVTSVLIEGFLEIYFRRWYASNSVRFWYLVIGISICVILVFLATENIATNLNAKDRISKKRIFLDNFDEDYKDKKLEHLKCWLFLDTTEYRNLASVKIKIFLRTLHYFSIMALISLLIILVFNRQEIAFTTLLPAIPSFFVTYAFISTQHWNQWKYCADLFNSLGNKKRGSSEFEITNINLLIDLVVLDMWSNKAFSTYFKSEIDALNLGITLSEDQVIDALERKQAQLLDESTRTSCDQKLPETE